MPVTLGEEQAMVVITTHQRDIIFDAVRAMYTDGGMSPGQGIPLPDRAGGV